MPDQYLYADDSGGRLYGDTGNDTLLGNALPNHIEGADGNDVIFGQDGDDFLVGNTGHDRLEGGSGRNYMIGGGGNDTLVAGGEFDVLNGGSGNDVYEISRSSNAVSFTVENGTDTLRFVDQDMDELAFVLTGWNTGLIGNAVDIAALGPSPFGTRTRTDELTGLLFSPTHTVFEYVEDQNGARVPMSDFLSYEGSLGADVLLNDEAVLMAHAGDDLIHGTVAQDHIDGGDGTDTLVHWSLSGTNGLGLWLDGVESWGVFEGQTVVNVENVYGTGGDDTIVGNSEDNRLTGGVGDDWLFAGAGNDILETTSGHNRAFGQQGQDSFLVLALRSTLYLDGGGGRDLLDHSANAFVGAGIRLDGGENWAAARGHTYVGIEDVAGTGGDDTIVGSAGRNRLDGGGGKDALWAGAGNDWLTGGEGGDTFYFARGYDRDLITDFEDGLDQIVLIGLNTSVDDAMDHAVENGGNVVLNFGGGDMLTVLNSSLAEVEAGLAIY